MVDIHNHLLPGVDDGAKSLDESMRHLKKLRNDGVVRLAVSPHLFGWLIREERGLESRLDRLEEVFADLQHAATLHDDLPRLYFNQEILCPTPEIATAVFREKRAGVRNSRYALVEFGFDLPDECIAIIEATLAGGRRMIISHPERYRRDGKPVTVREILTWKDAGAFLQVNGGSVLGDYGPDIMETAWQLVLNDHADLIATDHHADHREVSPARVAEALETRGVDARRLMSENPGRVLDDVDLISA